MAHLSRCDVVHRDLAARNVLVFTLSPSVLVKLGDFGSELRTCVGCARVWACWMEWAWKRGDPTGEGGGFSIFLRRLLWSPPSACWGCSAAVSRALSQAGDYYRSRNQDELPFR